MRVQFTSLIELFILVRASFHCGAQDQFSAALAHTAIRCQSTFTKCIQQSAHFAAAYDSKRFCDIFTFDESEMGKDVLPFRCLVSNGLCTEDEFDGLAYAACGRSISDFFVSEYETHFYAAIDTTSPACQDQILSCIYSSAVATVLKQEKRYCQLIQFSINGITSAACLNGHCSPHEYSVLRVAACDYEYRNYKEKMEEGFSDVLLLTSGQCRVAIDKCIDFEYTRNEKYCLALNQSNSNTETCLTNNGCSSKEIKYLQNKACKLNKAWATLSVMCLHSMMTCTTLSPIADYIRFGQRCDLFNQNFNGASAYQCLVQTGFCTSFEYNILKLALCNQYETEMVLSHALLSIVIEASNNTCQTNGLQCIKMSIIATLLKSDSQFCELMKLDTNGLSANTCLVGCSEEDKRWFKLAACNTSLSHIEPSPFTKSVLSTSQKCKNTIETCSFGSDLAYASIQSKQYCKLMNIYQSGAETYACLVGSGGCTDSEYQTMTDAACENDNE